MKDFSYGLVFLAAAILIFSAASYSVLAVYQPFKVWVAGYDVRKERLVGEAEFARAEQNRMILVEQARAEKESATLRAEAIAIVGQATKDFPEYRQQEFIGAFAEAVKSDSIQQIIYVPTEGNIPITEAARLNKGGN